MPETSNRRSAFSKKSSKDIMSSVRARNNTNTQAHHNADVQVKKRATYWMFIDLLKQLKRYAYKSDRSKSDIMNDALKEYMENHPVD